jgi:hypothetical protein
MPIAWAGKDTAAFWTSLISMSTPLQYLIVKRAMQISLDMIASRSPQDIRVLDLVKNSGVSQRTLEYAFLDRFAISPQHY